ncbi:MAG TPA: hypothetical protein VHL34_08185 [Rhizomicrobium sp.]|jgi:hypothetical protein|nr:hypothetical protein [Rhizomicrobium sp.]
MREGSPKTIFKQKDPQARRWVKALESEFGEFKDWAEQKARTLEVRQRARENGRNNLPLTDDREPDVAQQQIVDSFHTGVDSLKQALWNRLRGAHDLIVERIPKPLEPEPIKALARIEIVGIRERAKDELIALRHDERETWRDLKLFKGEHALARSANYPKPRPPMLVLTAIVAALILESIMNGMIFRNISPSYTVGGTVQAFAFSVVNVFLGYFALGLAAARYTTHRELWKRRLGWSGVSLVITLGLFWNLYVAHYREQAAEAMAANADPLHIIIDALRHMFRTNFALTSWEAIVLLLVGLMIFFALAVEGYHGWDDTYPGYGRVDRAHKDARTAFEEKTRELRAAITRRLDDVARDVATRLEADETAVTEAREIESEARQAELEARDSVTDLDRATLQSLRDYREANTYVRTTNPPAYFKDYPELEFELPENKDIKLRLDDAVAALDVNRTAKRVFDSTLGEWAKQEAENLRTFLDEVREEATFRADHERKGSLYLAPVPDAATGS